MGQAAHRTGFAIGVFMAASVLARSAVPLDVHADETPPKAFVPAVYEDCPLREVATEAQRGSAIAAALDRDEAAIKVGDFAAAAAALDCVEKLSAGSADWRMRYEVTRRRGVLRYRQERIVEALDLFEDALAMASRHGDRMAEAKSLKNVGAALRRLGEFSEALRAFLSSLDIYRRDGGDSPGPVLNNIADVYRNLRDPAQATRYYEEALAEYRKRGETIETAHTLESMAALALDGGDAAHAGAHLAEALAVYEQQGARSYELRVHAGLARAAIAQNEWAKAREWSEHGFDIAAQLGIPAPAPLMLQAARATRLLGAPARAAADLETAIARLPKDDIDRAGLVEELANAREAAGDAKGALTALREFHAADLDRREAEHDRELAWLRTRFETSERDRRIAALTAENEMRTLALRQRTIVLWLTLACGLAAALAAAFVLHRRRQRAHLIEAAREARRAQEIEQYRRAAAELVTDRKLLQAALDSRADAILVLDPAAIVVAANDSACRLLGRGRDAVVGRPLAEQIDPADAAAFAGAFERLEESSAAAILELHAGEAPDALRLHLAEAEQEDGLAIVGLEPAADGVPAVTAAPALPRDSRDEAAQPFRRALVELMLAVVEAWERATGQGRLELAERSRIWRVTIDDGRLRVRAMDRYLSLTRLPRQPRWRDVLRSAYFVLAECALEPAQRETLQQRIDEVLAYTRRRALV